jgi:hypothetical protein
MHNSDIYEENNPLIYTCFLKYFGQEKRTIYQAKYDIRHSNLTCSWYRRILSRYRILAKSSKGRFKTQPINSNQYELPESISYIFTEEIISISSVIFIPGHWLAYILRPGNIPR